MADDVRSLARMSMEDHKSAAYQWQSINYHMADEDNLGLQIIHVSGHELADCQ